MPNGRQFLMISTLFIILNPIAAMADDYWWVRCKTLAYGVDFNIQAQTASLILTVEGGGTIPAASTKIIQKQKISSQEKFALFDFGSDTKIGVRIQDSNQANIYRELMGKTYPVCSATVEIKGSQASQRGTAPACNINPDSFNGKGCKALIGRAYFNRENNRCEKIVWGGCPNEPPFKTVEECEETCH